MHDYRSQNGNYLEEVVDNLLQKSHSVLYIDLNGGYMGVYLC
jgi:hypothetical protein